MRIVAVAAAVPARTLSNDALGLPAEDQRKYEQNTGIHSRRVVGPDALTALDLCAAAAGPALDAAGWKSADVDGIIFITQTPDYILPPTSGLLQERLGMGKGVFAVEMNMGCSGFAYGLILAESLMAGGVVRRCLLAVGDTVSRLAPPDDMGMQFLFGDAGTVTLLDDQADEVRARAWGTDGSGAGSLIVESGGFRDRAQLATDQPSAPPRLFMDGAKVFVFALQRAVPAVKQLLQDTGWAPEDVTAAVFHQANRFILEQIASRCKMPMDRVALSLDDFGNTSGASMPLTLVTRLADALAAGGARLLLVGFGVGWSWAGVAMETGRVAVPPLIEVTPDKP